MHATRTGGPQSAPPRRLLALPSHQQQATPPVPLPAPAAPSRCTRPTPVAPPRCTPPMPAAPPRCTPPTNHRPCNERRLWQSKPAINVFRYRKSYIIVFRCSDFCHKRRSLHGGWLEHAINVFRYRKSYITVVRYSVFCHKRHSLHRRPTKRRKRHRLHGGGWGVPQTSFVTWAATRARHNQWPHAGSHPQPPLAHEPTAAHNRHATLASLRAILPNSPHQSKSRRRAAYLARRGNECPAWSRCGARGS